MTHFDDPKFRIMNLLVPLEMSSESWRTWESWSTSKLVNIISKTKERVLFLMLYCLSFPIPKERQFSASIYSGTKVSLETFLFFISAKT